MALTMTRTRTQATLTKLAEMVANVHGELAFLEGLLAGAAPAGSLAPEVRAWLAARRLKLLADREALYATIRQFDAGIDPAGIGSSEGWRGMLGSRGLSATAFGQRYCRAFAVAGACE